MPFEAAATTGATEDRAAEPTNDTTLKAFSSSPGQTLRLVKSSGSNAAAGTAIGDAAVTETAADAQKSVVSTHRPPSVGPNSFEKIRVLGVGSTGRVYLVRSIVRRVLDHLKGIVCRLRVTNDDRGSRTRASTP
jgi:hypothetical protein